MEKVEKVESDNHNRHIRAWPGDAHRIIMGKQTTAPTWWLYKRTGCNAVPHPGTACGTGRVETKQAQNDD